MIYISRIKIRGFKSFKLADLTFPRDFVCLAGPNGSGKSNICDAIRFAFGEMSLKNLRAKKAKELICQNARMAEVTVYIDGDEKHEIKRAIRDDGKIMYRLDGERATRTSVLNLLKKCSIDESGRNTIAQGEVNRIVNMSPKARREIIDSVAGISEFEGKKKEAMGDLEIVETRLREANLVLGEKIGMLNELEKEREVALKYIENRKLFNNARGSVIKKEIEKLARDLEKSIIDMQKISGALRGKKAELAELEAKISAREQEKASVLAEIEARQQKTALAKSLEALRLSIGRGEQELEDKRRQAAKVESELAALREEAARESAELRKREAELRKAEDECSALKPQREAACVLQKSHLRSLIDSEKSKLSSMREELARTDAEYSACVQLAAEKERSLGAVFQDNSARESQLASEIEILQKEIAEAKAGMEELFGQEKQANSEIADMEKRSVSLHEKIAAVRAQNPRLASNPAIEFINRSKGSDSGIYGTLIDLISFEPRYANAVEAAAGSRLLYVVVSDANVATKLIGKLKEAAAGRVTFIPLKEVKAASLSSNQGLGPLSDFIKYDSKIEKAVQYAFGETILVSGMDEAKKIGIGKFRMVTLDGEIFEKSGVITGGKISTGIAAAAVLAKLQSELAELKSARESKSAEISDIRERMSAMRSVRMEKEVRAKSLEVELSALRSEDEKRKKEREDAQRKKEEIAALAARIKALFARKTELEREIPSLSEKISRDEKSLVAEEEQFSKQNEEASRKRAELAARISALEAKRSALTDEIELRKTGMRRSESRAKQLAEEKSAHSSKISELERRLSREKDELAKKEHELAFSSRELESLFAKMKGAEEEIQGLGKQKGALSYECDKLEKENMALEMKKSAAETRLADLRSELEGSFREFEFMDREKEELMEIAKAAQAFLDANQNVNLISVELYDKKKAEVGDVRDKMQKLGVEKEAIMRMIEEIDARKKETFFTTFYAVNDNFRKMFRYIPQVGEGYLYLDKPSEPFESGLFLKIKRGTREMGTESLSGGEISLITLMFIFALQFVKPSPYYVLDEVDSALDKENSKNLAKLIKEMSKGSQFVIVTHNETVMTFASAVFGVSNAAGVSKVVGVRLESKIEAPTAEVIQ